MKLGYAARETAQNLWRNRLLTVASILTVAVSLTMVGAAFLFRAGVVQASRQWEEGVEFEVFMNVDATPDQLDRVGRLLSEHPEVSDVEFFSQDQQYELFQQMFANSPEYLENVTADVLPTSYRVEPDAADADVIRSIGDQMAVEPGVRQVVFAEETVRSVLDISRIAQRIILLVAVVMLLAAALLIFNSIRLAIFSRRREIEVMKLVGATNSFIRVPFMIEGLVQGFLGSAVAYLLVYFASGAAEDAASGWELLNGFVLSSGEVRTTGVLILAVGAAIGAVSAGVAVTRFLDV